jgi:hypothetical protein
MVVFNRPECPGSPGSSQPPLFSRSQFPAREIRLLDVSNWLSLLRTDDFPALKVKDAYNESFLVRKEQGRWKIHRYIFNSAMPSRAQ